MIHHQFPDRLIQIILPLPRRREPRDGHSDRFRQESDSRRAGSGGLSADRLLQRHHAPDFSWCDVRCAVRIHLVFRRGGRRHLPRRRRPENYTRPDAVGSSGTDFSHYSSGRDRSDHPLGPAAGGGRTAAPAFATPWRPRSRLAGVRSCLPMIHRYGGRLPETAFGRCMCRP